MNTHPVQRINISSFSYSLPDDLIARHPLDRRDACRLLVAMPPRELAPTDALAEVLPEKGVIAHRRFDEIVSLLPENTLLVRNNTKVINARLHFRKETGAEIEVFLLDPVDPADYALSFSSTNHCSWKCMVGNLKRWKEGPLTAAVTLPDGTETHIKAERLRPLPGNAHEIRFSWEPEVPFSDMISAFGNIPIPPYLNRESEESDLSDYQTVYATLNGSVAAPTAGLHFTEELFEKIMKADRGVEVADVTLHVGAGTFRPVKSETLSGHDMHSEPFTVTRAFITKLIEAIEEGRTVTAVGTTSVRTLESLPYIGSQLIDKASSGIGDEDREPLHVSQWDPYSGEVRLYEPLKALRAILTEMNYRNADSLTASTSILIGPGFPWQIVDAMVTNFHQPESTLLLLVAAFLGMTEDRTDRPDALWRKIYAEAVAEKYRFLSYGDACLFYRHTPEEAVCVHVPGSKSLSNRALVLDALSGRGVRFENLSDSGDTRCLSRAIEAILESNRTGKRIDLYMGDGAAPFRFAFALSGVIPSKIRFFVSQRLLGRLSSGPRPDYIFDSFPPFRTKVRSVSASRTSLSPEEIKAAGRPVASERASDLAYYPSPSPKKEKDAYTLSGFDFFMSSQELSALLLVSSRLKSSVVVKDMGAVFSLPYVLMTVLTALDFNGSIALKWTESLPESIRTEPGELRAPETMLIEGDWSALLNFIAFSVAARFAPAPRSLSIVCPECPEPHKSIQPDARAQEFMANVLRFKELGEKRKKDRRLEQSFLNIPDAFLPCLAAAVSAGVPLKALNIEALRIKESDRVSSAVSEFGKLGWKLSLRNFDGDLCLYFNGCRNAERDDNPLLDSHNDHRVAMALAATLPVTGRFRLRNPMCVAKSMPGFWDELNRLGVRNTYDKSSDIMQLEYCASV